MPLEVPVKVRLDGVSEAEKGLAGIGGSFTKMAASFATGQAVFELAKKSLEALKNITIESVKAYDDEVVSHVRLKKQFGESTESLIKLSEAREKATRYSHDEYQATFKTLGMHKLNAEQIKKLLPVIEEYAARSGAGLTETANAFSYAIQYGATRQLRQFGVELDKTGSQQSIFNALVDLGAKNTNKMAEELANIGLGPWAKITHELGESAEALGGIIVESGVWKGTMFLILESAKDLKWLLEDIAGKHKVEVTEKMKIVDLQKEQLELQQKIHLAERMGNNTSGTLAQPFALVVNNTQLDTEKARLIEITKLVDEYKNKHPEEKSALGTKNVLGGDKAAADAKKQLEEARKRYKDQEKALDDFQKQQNKTVDEIGNRKEKAARDRYKKQEEDLKKFEKEQNDISAKGADAQKKIEDDKLEETKRRTQEQAMMYVSLGAEIGSSIGKGISEGGEKGFKDALKGIVNTFLGFIETQALQAIAANTIREFGLIGPAAFLTGGLEAAGIATVVGVAKGASSKFAGGTVSVPGTGGGDSVNAWVKPGEMIANQGQKDNILAAIMNGGGTTNNNNASHTYHINNSVTVMGNIDPRAARDFNVSREASDRRLVLQLRRLNMSGQSQGVYSR
jgi:hypothetical protein